MKIAGYIFSVIAGVIFFYSFLISQNPIFQEQAIYWFIISLVAAVIPNLKTFKYKDIEFSLQESVKKIEAKVDSSINELNSTLTQSLEMIRASEASLSEDYKESRDKTFQNFHTKINELPEEERRNKQEYFTRKYLKNYGIDVSQLKRELKERGFFDGEINELFDQNTVEAIIKFQKHFNVDPADGIFGNMSFSKL